MRILLVSVSIEFPLSVYCLAAHAAATSESEYLIDLLHLDRARLSSYGRKNAEIWRYVAEVDDRRPDLVGFSVYLWNHLVVRELVEITARVWPRVGITVGGPELATPEAAEPWVSGGAVLAAVRGEGERTFVEVVERVAQGGGVRGVLGASWWDGAKVIHESDRPPA